jgi:two-component system chemotaxis sensor kinase CheA
MNTLFDIAEDEIQIFMAEGTEHLQTLDEGFVRLEKEGQDPNLLQGLFRAAHTLKGAAGAIGHGRMQQLTHSMETAMDGLRKGTLNVSAELVDTLLVALDILRMLLNEVVEDKLSEVDTTPVVVRLSQFVGGPPPAMLKPAGPPAAAIIPAGNSSLSVRVHLAPNAFASTARAFQIILALQSVGELISVEPSLAAVETLASVSTVTAQFATPQSGEAIRRALQGIPDIETVAVGEAASASTGIPVAAPAAASALKPTHPETQRLGEYLVSTGIISHTQLESAICEQINDPHFPPALLGQTLVKQGVLSQDTLDRAIAQQMAQLKSALQAAQTGADRDRTRGKAVEQTVRIGVERLDRLMNLVGELITSRNRLHQLHSRFAERWRSENTVEELGEATQTLNRLTDQLQEEVMRARMLPVSTVFSKFPRLVRDLARQTNKHVELEMRGEDTELDRTVIEIIGDPLIHMLRNAVDHGLETPAERVAAGKKPTGLVHLSARQEEGRIIIIVEDDGQGIDGDRVAASAIRKGLLSEADVAAMTPQQKVELIFMPSLSTAKEVSNLSGRGVGMDIVRSNVEKLNGSIGVETESGKGSTFTITLPLTLAIMPALLVQVRTPRAASGAATYAVPLATVMEALHVSANEIQHVNGKPVMQLRGTVLPLVWLGDVLDLEGGRARRPTGRDYVVAIRWGKQKMGLCVDRLVGEQEVVVKPLTAIHGEDLGVSGATILGDGQVALIADVAGLFKLAGARPAYKEDAKC